MKDEYASMDEPLRINENKRNNPLKIQENNIKVQFKEREMYNTNKHEKCYFYRYLQKKNSNNEISFHIQQNGKH